MKKLCLTSVLIMAFVLAASVPGFCKFRLKMPKISVPKINVPVKMAPLPLAGSQESSMGTGRSGAGLSIPALEKKPSLAPIEWSGESAAKPEAPEPPVPEDRRPELLFSPVGAPKEESPPPPAGKKPEAFAVRKIPVDFSTVVEGHNFPEQSMEDLADVHLVVSKLNDDLFEKYKGSATIITSANLAQDPPGPPILDPVEASRIVVYRGFRMTRQSARCFQFLEHLVKTRFPGRSVIITSTTGGVHLDPRHYEGKAIDFIVERLTVEESKSLEDLARKSGFIPFNEYIYSSRYKTGDHMHVDLR
ncbi:MAG: hypothetical protein RDV48_17485 [Candidatus Eremiobacteraeota bacterium]|nr:hypothetical protein [Candidatus Eremiobacteraeota bacterium]